MRADPRADRKALAVWLKARQSAWQSLARQVLADRERAAPESQAVLALASGFRQVVADLALARTVLPGSGLTRQLEELALRLHRIVYRAPRNAREDLLGLFAYEIGPLMRRLAGKLLVVTLWFSGTAIAAWWLVSHNLELIGLFASEQMIEGVERGEIWTDGLLNVVPSSVLSLSIFTNNLVVTLFCASLGTLYGAGTLYIVGINGLMLGGLFAFTAHYGMAERLFQFIVPHGMVELSVIMVAGAAGMGIGEALARPGSLPRALAFRRAVHEASRVLMVCAPFLLGAGLIEGYASPDPGLSPAARLAIGIAYELVFILVLSGGLSAVHRRYRGPRR
ncbi:MAG: stage II sporulation protein M [Gammaproteobacteria bacterium]